MLRATRITSIGVTKRISSFDNKGKNTHHARREEIRVQDEVIYITEITALVQ